MSDYQVAIEQMRSMLKADDASIESFNRKDYRPKFDKLYQSWLPGFDAIEALYTSVKEPDTMLDYMADALAVSAAETIDAIDRKNRKDQALMNMNLQLAVYVFPAILHYKGSFSHDLAEKIRVRWKEQFPKTNVTPAELEYIESGFHRKFCYITTAVCRTLHKGDDCEELMTLRRYRDSYLASSEDGEELIRMYYDIAPTIVKHIDAQEDSEQIYGRIWKEYISGCLNLIRDGKPDECRSRYIEMVYDLKNSYFLT